MVKRNPRLHSRASALAEPMCCVRLPESVNTTRGSCVVSHCVASALAVLTELEGQIKNTRRVEQEKGSQSRGRGQTA